MLLRLATAPLYSVLPLLLSRQGWATASIGEVFTVVGLSTELASAVGWCLVIAAAFVRDAPAEP